MLTRNIVHPHCIPHRAELRVYVYRHSQRVAGVDQGPPILSPSSTALRLVARPRLPCNLSRIELHSNSPPLPVSSTATIHHPPDRPRLRSNAHTTPSPLPVPYCFLSLLSHTRTLNNFFVSTPSSSIAPRPLAPTPARHGRQERQTDELAQLRQGRREYTLSRSLYSPRHPSVMWLTAWPLRRASRTHLRLPLVPTHTPSVRDHGPL